jgi:hypothetical protein
MNYSVQTLYIFLIFSSIQHLPTVTVFPPLSSPDCSEVVAVVVEMALVH